MSDTAEETFTVRVAVTGGRTPVSVEVPTDGSWTVQQALVEAGIEVGDGRTVSLNAQIVNDPSRRNLVPPATGATVILVNPKISNG